MVDTPFVSEDFQRAFRNQFPSQVNSGRDLHVSDVVVPIVDFTPTASGASLPNSLQFCRSKNTGRFQVTSNQSGATVPTAVGFVGLSILQSGDGGDVDSALYIDTTASIVSQININNGSSNATTYREEFVVYVPAGSLLKCDLTIASSGTFTVMSTVLADVNGNLIQPSGYSPQ